MKKIVYILSFLCLFVVVVVSGYIISDDMRFFIKSLKHPWVTPYTPEKFIDDEYKIAQCDYLSYEQKIQSLQDEIAFLKQTKTGFSNSGSLKNGTGTQSSGTLLQTEKNVMLTSFSGVVFQEKLYDDFFQIFGITDEFPKKYITFLAPDIEMYSFYESSYDDVYTFFDVVSYDLPLTLNKTNTFGERSFFINLKSKDDFVRLVIQVEKKVFGLKIKNTSYNKVKAILDTF